MVKSRCEALTAVVTVTIPLETSWPVTTYKQKRVVVDIACQMEPARTCLGRRIQQSRYRPIQHPRVILKSEQQSNQPMRPRVPLSLVASVSLALTGGCWLITTSTSNL